MLTVDGGVAPRCNTAAALKETSFAEMKVRKNSTVYVKCQAWSDYSKHWPYPYKLQDCYFKGTVHHMSLC